jgi:glutathione S-transferase
VIREFEVADVDAERARLVEPTPTQGGGPMLELYHHGSSACAAKVRFALEEKRLEWSGHVVDIFRGEQFRSDFQALNPKAVVPVLVHDGFLVPESTIICEYLEDAFPDWPIYPTSARGRAQVRFWTKAVDEELHPACAAITYIVSHRHTILRNGSGSFEEFLKSGGSEGAAARRLKWEWIQHGVEAPGAEEKIRIIWHLRLGPVYISLAEPERAEDPASWRKERAPTFRRRLPCDAAAQRPPSAAKWAQDHMYIASSSGGYGYAHCDATDVRRRLG